MTIKLRTYQQEAIEAIINTDVNGIIKLPTGSGKTVIFTELIHQNLNKKFLILTDRKILINQIKNYLKTNNYELITRQKIQNFDVKQLKLFLFDFNFILIDEAHGVNYEQGGYNYVASNTPTHTKIIGFTATPFRLKGSSTEVIYGKNKIFKKIIYEKSYNQLVDTGYLSPIKYIVNKDNYDSLQHDTIGRRGSDTSIYNDSMCKGFRVYNVLETINLYKINKAIIYCISIEHANLLKTVLENNNLQCLMYHSKLTDDELETNLKIFKNMSNGFIINVNMLTTGFDYPALEVAICARPTISSGLWYQILGRLTRTYDNKKYGVVYDIVGNYFKHGKLDEHNGISFKPNTVKKDVVIIYNGCKKDKEIEDGDLNFIEIEDVDKKDIYSISRCYKYMTKTGKESVVVQFNNGINTVSLYLIKGTYYINKHLSCLGIDINNINFNTLPYIIKNEFKGDKFSVIYDDNKFVQSFNKI